MTACLTLNVSGLPSPQGSKVAFRQGERVVMLEGKPKQRAELAVWREAVAREARLRVADLPADTDDADRLRFGPTRVRIVFRLRKPKTVRRAVPIVRPDIDKLSRAVLDALTGPVLVDDARVLELWAIKRYVSDGELPGAYVVVEECGA